MICPDRGVVIEARCLAKSDNAAAAAAGNPSRDPLWRLGDLPAGEYVARLEPRPMLPVETYGPHRPLRLIPQSGPALQARRNGRTGLLLHGGVLNKWKKLRPTLGCCRDDDETQEAIVAEMVRAVLTEIPLIVKEEG